MATKPRAGRSAERRQFGMGWALGLSVVFHVLLFLFGGWLPGLRPALAAEPEETVLQFSFAQPSDTDERSSPEGDVPFETSPAPRSIPVPPSQAVPDRPPPSVDLLDPATAPPPGESRPPVDPATERQPADSPPIENPRETDDAGVDETPDPSTPQFPTDDRDPTFREPREVQEAASPKTQERDERFDLDGAIQDFGRILERARANAPPADAAPGPPRNVYVPDPAELNTSGYGLGNLVFETSDFDWSDYAAAVYTQIWRAWHNRLLRMTNEFEKWAYVNREPNLRHANQIRFVIERSGQVTGIMIEGPSGCEPLDDSATQALAEVILPPLPDAFPKEREVVHAQFIGIGEIRYMKPTLTRMKALNYF